jgi:hypothetical protein
MDINYCAGTPPPTWLWRKRILSAPTGLFMALFLCRKFTCSSTTLVITRLQRRVPLGVVHIHHGTWLCAVLCHRSCILWTFLMLSHKSLRSFVGVLLTLNPLPVKFIDSLRAVTHICPHDSDFSPSWLHSECLFHQLTFYEELGYFDYRFVHRYGTRFQTYYTVGSAL